MVMNYAGMIRGICSTLEFGGMQYETEEDYAFMHSLKDKFMDIAMDLECVARGMDPVLPNPQEEMLMKDVH